MLAEDVRIGMYVKILPSKQHLYGDNAGPYIVEEVYTGTYGIADEHFDPGKALKVRHVSTGVHTYVPIEWLRESGDVRAELDDKKLGAVVREEIARFDPDSPMGDLVKQIAEIHAAHEETIANLTNQCARLVNEVTDLVLAEQAREVVVSQLESELREVRELASTRQAEIERLGKQLVEIKPLVRTLRTEDRSALRIGARLLDGLRALHLPSDTRAHDAACAIRLILGDA